MEKIDGHYWLNKNYYLNFLRYFGDVNKLTNKEIFEGELELLKQAVKRHDNYDMILRSSNNLTLFPGEASELMTNVPTYLIKSYNVSVDLIDYLDIKTWLSISRTMLCESNMISLLIRNLSQYSMALEESIRVGVFPKVYDIYLYTLDEMDKTLNSDFYDNKHVAYRIQEGDPIAVLKLKK